MSPIINLDEQEIVRMYEEGMTFLNIAEKLNISKDTVRSRLRKNNIILPAGRKKFEIENNDFLILYNMGKTINEISETLGIKNHIIRARLLENKIGLRRCGPKRKILVNDNFFTQPNNENCYWAGFIAADGNVQNNQLNILLKDIDINHLEKFKSIIQLSSIVRTKNNGKYKRSALRFRSNQVISDLRNNFNIVPNKSLILLPPNIFEEQLIKAYIRGYFDGDGCISRGRYLNFEIYSGSRDILEWIKIEIKNFLDVGNPNVKHKNGNTYRISFSGNRQVIEIMNWLYKDCDTNYLERKKIKFENFLED